MRVSSPIGELPFEPRTLTYRGGTLVVDGLMGAWPARVVIEPGDLPAVVRLIARPAALAAAGAAALTVLAAVRRHR
jgi:hypothetical protein